MAVARNHPYPAFNFLCIAERIGGGDGNSIQAGFQEISGISMEVAVAEYRNGNERENHVRKVNGLAKYTDVTLKRGAIGQVDLADWLRLTAEGDQTVRTTVTIELWDEARTGPVMTWKLTNARPMKYTGVTLNAKTSTDVGMEELVLSCEKIELL